MSNQKQKNEDPNMTIEIGAAIVKATLGLSAFVAGQYLHLPQLGIVSITAGAIVDVLKTTLKDRGARRLGLMAAGYAHAEPSQLPEDVQESIEEKKNDRVAGEALLEAFEASMRALDEEVAPYIGYLVNLHINKKLVLGRWFFRSFSRVLTEIEHNELLTLRSLFTKVMEQPPLEHSGKVLVNTAADEWRMHNGKRLLNLLKREGLADEQSSENWEDFSAAEVALFTHETTQEMLNVIKENLATSGIFVGAFQESV